MASSKEFRVFISYRRENGGTAYAYILNERLSSIGIRCFFDIQSMNDYNGDFEKRIKNNIESSDYVIVLLQNGCLVERKQRDYFLEEIRFARENKKQIILLPIGDAFVWEAQKDLPLDISEISRLNLCVPLKLENVNESICSVLGMMKQENKHEHYLLLFRMQIAAMSNVVAPLMQKTSDIYYIDMEERWRHARRISLMAVGCSSVVTRFAPLIKKKAKLGTKFRFLAIDPEGDSAKDFICNKINANVDGARNDFLKHNYAKTVQLINSMQMEEDRISYRLTSDHITFTMHWVECNSDDESYIYVEFLPTYANNIVQDSHCAIIVKRCDPLYMFYVEQFDECWRKSRNVYSVNRTKNCEFCYPPKADDKYILCDTRYWRIYFANNQNYPGRCIIPLRRHCANLSDLTSREMDDFHQIVKMLERIWKEELGATNFNWTCLMNGGYSVTPYIPHVHFHFIPRFDRPLPISDGGFFVDTQFGAHYELSDAFQLPLYDRLELCARLRKRIAEFQVER